MGVYGHPLTICPGARYGSTRTRLLGACSRRRKLRSHDDECIEIGRRTEEGCGHVAS